MKIQTGPFEFRYTKEKPDMSTQESHIRSAPKTDETRTDDNTSKFFVGASMLVKTYFVCKMADRVLEKVLR